MEISVELKTKYLSRRDKDLEDCLAALQFRDLALLERVGHQMKGNALTFGFAPLAEIGEAMETAARAADWSELQDRVTKMGQFLKTLVRP